MPTSHQIIDIQIVHDSSALAFLVHLENSGSFQLNEGGRDDEQASACSCLVLDRDEAANGQFLVHIAIVLYPLLYYLCYILQSNKKLPPSL